MSQRLDDELQALKAEGPDGRLDYVEARVWRRIDAVREARSIGSIFLPVRAAAVVGALAIGIAGGGFAAAAGATDPHEISVFSIHTRLAPSTLLDGHE